MFRRLFLITLVLFIVINAVYAQEEDWMPDPNLRKAVRERLIQQGIGIPENTPLTPESITRMGRVDWTFGQ